GPRPSGRQPVPRKSTRSRPGRSIWPGCGSTWIPGPRAWSPGKTAPEARGRTGGPSRCRPVDRGARPAGGARRRRPGGGAGGGRRARPWVLDECTEAGEQGRARKVEAYLRHLDPADSQGAVELIYREYCLAEAEGEAPDPASYLARFPQNRAALEPLLELHAA